MRHMRRKGVMHEPLFALVARCERVMSRFLEAARAAADPAHLVTARSSYSAELRHLIARLLPHDTQAERDWTLSIALADAENALISFRALMADL